MSKTILLLYANSGGLGHKIIAENYVSLLRKNGYDVEIADVLEVDDKAAIRLGKQLYFWLLRKLPWVWRWLYDYWHFVPASNWLRTSALPRRFKRSQRLVLSLRPDLVVTTHPTATSIVNLLKAEHKISCEIFTAFSDWHTQKFWIFPHVDKYLVATQQQKDDLLRLGFGDNRISVTGILLSDDFYQAPSKRRARELLDLPQDIPVILVMGGGKGLGIERIVSELLNLPSPTQIIVLGANKIRNEEIWRYLNSKSVHKAHFTIMGFVDPIIFFSAADLLVSKPGGLTTSQAFLLSLPIFPAYPLPGQEDKNLEVLHSYKAVLSIKKDITLADQINQLLTNQAYLKRISRAALYLAPSQAREKILSLVIGDPQSKEETQ